MKRIGASLMSSVRIETVVERWILKSFCTNCQAYRPDSLQTFLNKPIPAVNQCKARDDEP